MAKKPDEQSADRTEHSAALSRYRREKVPAVPYVSPLREPEWCDTRGCLLPLHDGPCLISRTGWGAGSYKRNRYRI